MEPPTPILWGLRYARAAVPSRLRRCLLLLVLPVLAAGCGSSGGGNASTATLLKDTFSGGKTVKSGKSYLKEQIAPLEETCTDSAGREKAALEAQLQKLEAREKELKKAKKTFKDEEEKLRNKVDAKRTTFTDAEARELVLKKFHDLARSEMHRYLNVRKRNIVSIFEHLWNKYRLPMIDITKMRDSSARKLDSFLDQLHYSQ